MGNNEDHEESLKGPLSGTESEQNNLKSKFIKIMWPDVNEVHSDEEITMQEEEEVANYNQDVLHADEEGTLNNAGSLKGVI